MVTEMRPTHVRRQLGRRLRKLREQAGRTMEDVITSGVAGRFELWRLEGGRGAVKPGDILVLTRHYEAEPAVVDQQVTFRIERQQRFFARPATLKVVVTAGVMHVRVGSDPVMEEQVAHLRAVSIKGAARISVLRRRTACTER